MRAPLKKAVLAIVAIGILALVYAPPALADSITFDLTSNNLGLSGSVGAVVIMDSGMNQVTVTITMNSGFSLKLPGGDVALNGVSGLTAGSTSGIAATVGMIGFTGLSFQQFFAGKNISEFGTFAFDYANLKGGPKGVVSADSLTFTLSAPGLMANQFTGVAIHFCTASGGGCGPKTGFASNGPLVPVPEPGTLTLFGTGLFGFACVVRRRIRR